MEVVQTFIMMAICVFIFCILIGLVIFFVVQKSKLAKDIDNLKTEQKALNLRATDAIEEATKMKAQLAPALEEVTALKAQLASAHLLAANTFAQKSMLEAQITTASQQPDAPIPMQTQTGEAIQMQTLGLQILPRSASIGSIVLTLKAILSVGQSLGCQESKLFFEQIKNEIIAGVRESAPPEGISCSKIAAVVKAESLTAATELQMEQKRIHDQNATAMLLINPQEIQSLMVSLWETVAAEICDKNGIVNLDLLDAFIVAIYKSVCP